MLAANTNGNVQVALPFRVANEVQEFGFYPMWLPAVYKAYGPATKSVADDVPSDIIDNIPVNKADGPGPQGDVPSDVVDNTPLDLP
jgi:hypothetical protein